MLKDWKSYKKYLVKLLRTGGIGLFLFVQRSAWSLYKKIDRSSYPVYFGRFFSFIKDAWNKDAVIATDWLVYVTSDGLDVDFRGWSDGDIDNSSIYIFGGLTGDDEKPERLNDLWELQINLIHNHD